MATRQLWLFDPPKPLIERFGEDFFRALPTGPGVYLMSGDSEGVLYVGKARNLRQRLSSYRIANPERFPRRIIRLLYQVRRIEWDECPTEEAAAGREELLICVLAPKFNRAGKVWPRSKEQDHEQRKQITPPDSPRSARRSSNDFSPVSGFTPPTGSAKDPNSRRG